MKASLLVLGLALVCHAGHAADLTLTDGRVFHDASVLSQTPRTVVIKHTDGLSGVSKTLLPADLSVRYPIDEAAALAADQQATAARIRAQEFHKAEAERSARLRLEREQTALLNAQIAAQEATARLAEAEAARIQRTEPAYDPFPFYRSYYNTYPLTTACDNRWNDNRRGQSFVYHRSNGYSDRNSNTRCPSPAQNSASIKTSRHIHTQSVSSQSSRTQSWEDMKKPVQTATFVRR
ncbi:MAG: hypothetical protein QM760_14925 [Nibricoccus sp.]